MRVAIIGTAPDSRMLAPFHDQEWDIWVCSPGNRRAIPRVTQWFELHGVMDMKGPENADWQPDYFQWLNEQSFPIYMQEPNDLCPQAQVFPIRAWLREFGDWGREAATSSIALMIGYAIMQGAKEIGIWGVDMADVTEAYSGQKTGCRIMLKLASDRGIKVTVPLESCLATPPPLYGYAEASRMGRRLLVRKNSIEAAINNAQAQMNHWERQLYTFRGMLDNLTYIQRTWVDGEADCMIDAVETEIEIGGQKANVVHSRGTTVTASGGEGGLAMAQRSPPVHIPVVGGLEAIETLELPSGILVPQGKANSGAHAEE